MAEIPDTEILTAIEAALATGGRSIRIPFALRDRFQKDQNKQHRPLNRLGVMLVMVVFDLFWFMEFSSAPEILGLSALLRFAILTPLVILYLALDWFDRLGRFYDVALLVLAILPGLIAGVIYINTTSPSALPDARAGALILLSTGIIWRIRLSMQIANVVISLLAYSIFISASVFVPKAELPSMIMTEIAIAAGVLLFAWQMGVRDRRIFLLHTAEKMHCAELAAHNSHLLQQTQTDALTGVANRRCFDDRLAASWDDSRCNNYDISLIMIDIDNFKKFNDYYGHQAGDECLTRVARKIREQLRNGDLVARYGGEEFAVIMAGASLDRATTIAERIRSAIEGMALPHAGAGPGAFVTISVGLASMRPTVQNSARALVEWADHGLYDAKRGGRNRVCRHCGGNEAAPAHAA